MRLSIIEIDYHPEVLQNLCRLFQVHTSTWQQLGLRLAVYASPSVCQKAGGAERFPEMEWHVPMKGESIPDFIRRHQADLHASDAVFFNTLASHFRFFAQWKCPAPIVLRVHNASAYLNPEARWKPVFSPFFLWKDFSHFMRKEIGEREAHWRKRFVERVDAFQFPDSGIASFVEESGWMKGRRSVPPLPFAEAPEMAAKPVLPSQEGPVHATVIGGIDPRRRDYEGLLAALSMAVPQFDRPLNLCLLGRPRGPYGQRMLQGFKSLEGPQFQVEAFDAFVPQDVFENRIGKTDFLFIPALASTRYTVWTESYGKTKISGNVYDMVRFAKPAILPAHYRLPTGLDGMVDRYSDTADLASKALDWVNGKQLELRQAHAQESLAGFRREALGKRLVEFLEAVRALNQSAC